MLNSGHGAIQIGAMLTSAAATFLLGGVWYGVLFPKVWARAYGFTAEQLQAMSARPARTFSLLFACDLALAAGLSLLAGTAGVVSALDGIRLGLLVWGGAVAPLAFATQVGSGRPVLGYVVDGGRQLAACVVAGAIIGAWR